MKKLEFEKWRAIRAGVGGVGDVLAWVMYLRRWRASVLCTRVICQLW